MGEGCVLVEREVGVPRDEPLSQLLVDINSGVALSDDWIDRFAGDANADHTLERLWRGCLDVEVMMRIAYAFVDQPTLVKACAACARLALDFAPASDDRLVTAVEVAERWSMGEASAEQADAAGDRAYEVVLRVNSATRFAAAAVSDAVGASEELKAEAMSAAASPRARPVAYDAAFAAADAAFAASEVDPAFAVDPAAYCAEYAACACERSAKEGRRKVADLIVRHLPAPTEARISAREGEGRWLLPQAMYEDEPT